jgi:hypothetical protein
MRAKNDWEQEYDRKYKDYLIGKDGEYKCAKCKKVWIPTDADINRKAMMTYYNVVRDVDCIYIIEDARRTVRPFGRTEAERKLLIRIAEAEREAAEREAEWAA